MASVTHNMYHATLKNNAVEITNTQIFKYDKHAINQKFLGEGIYFYTERINAVDWTIKMYKDENRKLPDNASEIIDNYRIVTADILVDEKRVLNLDLREEIEKINILANIVNDHLGKYAQHYNKPVDVLLNYLMKNNFLNNIDIVEKTFTYPVKSNKYLSGVNYINKKVICIKNNNIITNANISKKITQKEYNNSIFIFREGRD